MNPYRFAGTCDVCGGEGMGDKHANAASWTQGGFVSHRNPRVCAEIIREREQRRLAEVTSIKKGRTS